MALTAEKTKLALIFSLFVIVAALLGMVLASPFAALKAYSASVTMALVITSIGSIALIRPLFGVTLPVRELVKIGGAAAIMLGAMVLVTRFWQGTVMTIGGIIVGGSAYLGVSLLLRSRAVGDILRLRHI